MNLNHIYVLTEITFSHKASTCTDSKRWTMSLIFWTLKSPEEEKRTHLNVWNKLSRVFLALLVERGTVAPVEAVCKQLRKDQQEEVDQPKDAQRKASRRHAQCIRRSIVQRRSDVSKLSLQYINRCVIISRHSSNSVIGSNITNLGGSSSVDQSPVGHVVWRRIEETIDCNGVERYEVKHVHQHLKYMRIYSRGNQTCSLYCIYGQHLTAYSELSLN